MFYKRSKQSTRNPSFTQLPFSQKLSLSYVQITRSLWWSWQEQDAGFAELLGKRGNSNTTYLILCYDVCEEYIRPVSKSKSPNVARSPRKLCSQHRLFFTFHMHTRKYFRFVMTLLCTETLIPRRFLWSTQKRYLLLARRPACRVYSTQKHSLLLGVHQHVSN